MKSKQKVIALNVAESPLSRRPFHGLGVQADPIWRQTDAAKWGVNQTDIALIEDRLRALRPAVARLFMDLRWLDKPDIMANFDRQMRLLAELGTRVNLVLFEPNKVTPAELPALVDAMLPLLKRHANVAWLTLYNEPDSFFLHESKLARTLFGQNFAKSKLRWKDYVNICRYADRRLREQGLYPRVRLALPDCVWGHPMRRERLELALRDLGDLDAGIAYHQYNPEYPEFYTSANYAYPGMRQETTLFRKLVGPRRELICWEFNGAGVGFGNTFPGVGRNGEDLLGSFAGAVEITDKILTAFNHGVDGMCVWCLSDGPYLPVIKEPTSSLMKFGLWRFKHEGWLLRPYYHYFAALCQSLRPPGQLLHVTGVNKQVSAVALREPKRTTLAVLNKSATPVTVTANLPAHGRLLRVVPTQLSPQDAKVPAPTNVRTRRFTLQPAELIIYTTRP